jgi:hypothetical protein
MADEKNTKPRLLMNTEPRTKHIKVAVGGESKEVIRLDIAPLQKCEADAEFLRLVDKNPAAKAIFDTLVPADSAAAKEALERAKQEEMAAAVDTAKGAANALPEFPVARPRRGLQGVTSNPVDFGVSAA